MRHNPPTVFSVSQDYRGIYAHAVEAPAAARILFISAQVGIGMDRKIRPGFAEQLEQAMDHVEALLAAASMTTANLVKVDYQITRTQDLPLLVETRRKRWNSATPPAVTVTVVAALANPEFLVQLGAVAAA